jgi:uncharacterized membrane protein required for colicin V production
MWITTFFTIKRSWYFGKKGLEKLNDKYFPLMKDKGNPLTLAIRSIVFPFTTLFIGSLILFLIHTCCQHLGLGGVIGFLPFLLIALFLLIIGIIVGMRSGVATLKLAKELSPDKKSKVLSYACLGIALSLLELGVFYWLLLVYPASV